MVVYMDPRGGIPGPKPRTPSEVSPDGEDPESFYFKSIRKHGTIGK